MKPKRAAIYTRISSDPQGRRLGVDRQREALHALATALGWTAAEVYEDNDLSASKGKRRPRYEQMLADCESGHRDGILVLNVDRLTRNLPEFATFMAWREQHGVAFATTEGDNSETSSGRQVLGIKAVLAQGEAERISERVVKALEQRAQRGKPHGGGDRTYGYASDGAVLDDEAAVIRECAERVLSGDSLRSVVNDLNARGVRTAGRRKAKGANGEPSAWVSSTLRRMLSNPRLAGLVVYKGQVLRDVETTWDAILTVQQHEALVRIFYVRRGTGVGGQYVYLGTGGLVRCGICGGPMNGRPRNGVRHYACNARPGTTYCGRLRVVAEPVERHIAESVFAALDSPDFGQALAAADSTEDEAAEARQRLRDGQRALEDLEVRYGVGDIGRPAFLRSKEVLERRVEDAAKDVERLTGDAMLARLPQGADAARALWDERGVDWQRALVSVLIEDVTVRPVPVMGRNTFDPERVTIRWRV
jgi:site-specific DNA recombinase